MLSREAKSHGDGEGFPSGPSGLSLTMSGSDRKERDALFFKSDTMYQHQLVRINYTTYDVRRSQDTINPKTSHCDVMLLAQPNEDSESDSEPEHRFLYARVLGIYHVNVIYTGPGMLDYRPRRLEFLWVRRFVPVGKRSADCTLDCICFPPMADGNSFGFIDPTDVLRGCHIIPVFKSGKVHSDGVALSRCASDFQDWRNYAVNRCVIYVVTHGF
jgi:hypothetical protein